MVLETKELWQTLHLSTHHPIAQLTLWTERSGPTEESRGVLHLHLPHFPHNNDVMLYNILMCWRSARLLD